MIYVSQFIGSGTREDPFRPEGTDELFYSAVDLRDDPTVVGECLVSVPQSGRRDVQGTAIEDKKEIRDYVCDRLLRKVQPSSTRKVKEIWLGGELIHSEPAEVTSPSNLIDPSDDFNRPDNLSIGPNWNLLGDLLLQIKSNQLFMPATPSSISAAQHVTAAASDDQFVQITLYTVEPVYSGFNHYIMLRSNDTWSHYYSCIMTPTNQHRILKSVSGAWTLLVNDFSGYAPGEIMRLEAEGSTLRCLRNGTNIPGSPVTDTDIIGASFRRFGIMLQAGSTALNAIVDDFVAGDFFIPPEPEPPSLARGPGMEQYRQHLRQQAVALDDEELLLILSEAFGVIK
jgi:hypothetical protein